METIEEDTHDVPTDWSHLFTWHRNPYYGYCETGEQVDELIELFSYLSSTSFVVTRTTKNFGQINGCHKLTSAHGSGRRYSVLLQKFLFPFAKGSPRWLYRQGTFLAQMVGYRCNFKNWVQIFFWGGRRRVVTPIKICGPQIPQYCDPKSEHVVQLILAIGPENDYPKLLSKFRGLPPLKNLRGVKV